MSTKAEDTQKNILNTARKHFLKDGLTGASLRNIVKDADLLLVHFTNIIRRKRHFLMH